MTDARALMWVAACRKYRILAEFAREVLDERLRTFQTEIRVTDFDALLDAKGVHAEEIARLTTSTRARLRSGAFRMLREAELIELERRAMAMREARQAKEQAVSMNLQSLALTHPDIYNSVSAGRPLPRGATWIGGARRDDLLQELGAEMAQGSFMQQPGA